METFWLLGRLDMDEANDSMVCKFVPRKKKPGDKKKKKTPKQKRIEEEGNLDSPSLEVQWTVLFN